MTAFRVPLCLLTQILLTLFVDISGAYKPLSDSFLEAISSGGSVLDPGNGTLLAPILIPRVPGTVGHTTVQHHFLDFFSTKLPKWTLEWSNSTTESQVPIENIIFEREPPWTKAGQANWLTLAAHYDSKSHPVGSIGISDGAVPCALLMHVASSIDQYVTQMHDEMLALGEGGTVEMDMGVRIVFLDGKESFNNTEPGLHGSTALSKTWEETRNPAGSKYPNALSQVQMFILLDNLGLPNPTVPSYLSWTAWAHSNMANLECRFRRLGLLETSPSETFLDITNERIGQLETISDHTPFMKRGVPFIHLLPSAKQDNTTNGIDLSTIKDWAKLMVGFTLEWLDMMEVWPDDINVR